MSAIFRSLNPKNNKLHRTFEAINENQLEQIIERGYQRYRFHYAEGTTQMQERYDKLDALHSIFDKNKAHYAGLISQEMGKPITQATAEIEKCMGHFKYYKENTDRFLEDEHLPYVANPNQSGLICHQPLGPTLGKSTFVFLHAMVDLYPLFLILNLLRSNRTMELPLLGADQVNYSPYGSRQLHTAEAFSINAPLCSSHPRCHE